MAFFRRFLSLFGGGEKPSAREAAPQVLAIAEELRRSGRLPEAVDTLRRAAAASPANVGLHVALGRALLHAERHDEAIAALQDALAMDRENLVAIRQLAEAYLRKGEKVEAIKKLKLYRGLKPGDRDVAELIEKLDAELRPTRPLSEAPPKEITTAPVVPPGATQTSGAARREPDDTAPIPPASPPRAEPAAAPAASARPAFAAANVGTEGSAAAELDRPAALEAAPPAAGESAPPAAAVTETLADLYRSQGYVADARTAYASLAESAEDPGRRQALLEKAEAAVRAPLGTPEARLRAFLSRLPGKGDAAVPDMGGVLAELVARTEGVRAAALTDLEGLPVVTAGSAPDAPLLETLIAELTAFWKGVGRIDGDLGTGSLDTLTLSAANGGAVVSSVTGDYALILHVEPGAPMGRIRYEAARAAWLLRPAVG